MTELGSLGSKEIHIFPRPWTGRFVREISTNFRKQFLLLLELCGNVNSLLSGFLTRNWRGAAGGQLRSVHLETIARFERLGGGTDGVNERHRLLIRLATTGASLQP